MRYNVLIAEILCAFMTSSEVPYVILHHMLYSFMHN